VAEQPVELHVQPGEVDAVGHVPGLGQHAGEVGLLGEQVGGPVAHATGLDQHHLGVGPEQVEEDVLVGREPRQPGLHPVEGQPLGQPLPLLAAPGLARHQRRRPLAYGVGGQQLPAREEDDLLDRVAAALVADAEGGQPVDLVAPEVDAHGSVRGARVDVDDRAPHRHLAPGLDLVLPAVAGLDQAADELVGVDLVARVHDDRLDVLDVGTEALDEGPDRRHHDLGPVTSLRAQAPHGAEPTAHGLDARAHPLERQRLPGREQLDGIGAEVLGQVVDEALGVATSRHRHQQRGPTRQVGEPRDRDRPRRFGHGQHSVGPTEDLGDRRLVAQPRGEVLQGHRSRLPIGGKPQERLAYTVRA
jgi:hypothetical protein